MIDIERLDPELRFMAIGESPFDFSFDMDMTAAREFMPLIPIDEPDKLHIWDEYTQSYDGADIRLKMYEPAEGRPKPSCAVFWMHGGGMALGSPEADDWQCARMALESEALVCSVDYRLTPEYAYPTQPEDCYAAYTWLIENASALGIAPGRVAIAGASAGGNLCLVLALMLRDRGGNMPVFQMPLFPMADDRMNTDSALALDKEAVPFAWNTDFSKIAWSWYLRDIAGDDIPAYAAPARAPGLEGLPPAYTCSSEFDPLRDETMVLASKFMAAGVPCELHIYPGAFHAFETLREAGVARRAADEYCKALSEALKKSGEGRV